MNPSLFILTVLIAACGAHAPNPASSQLTQIILTKDSLLFEQGYNRCNTEVLEQLISTEFSFYHDEGGITESKAQFIDGIQNGLCNLPYKALREIDSASIEVYPLYDQGQLYGAIQNGKHRFYAIHSNDKKELTSTARFTHLWVLEEEVWRLRTVLSYNHSKGARR